MNNMRLQVKLWRWQRLSAMVLALAVCVHLAVIIWAVHAGLSAQALLGRTQGNLAFGLFYTVFVLACAVHVPIGLMKIAEEWLSWRGTRALVLGLLAGAWILLAGLRAVYAVVGT